MLTVSGAFVPGRSFGLILNEPAGQLACIIVRHAVNLIVRAWDDSSMNPDHVASDSESVKGNGALGLRSPKC